MGKNAIVDLVRLKDYHDRKVIPLLNGKADLEDGHVKADQLQLKTINGQSLKGTGNIAIDLTLYTIVAALPTEDINPDKIYMVAKDGAPEGNVYTEYLYVDSKWEEIGEYKANVDLAPYLKKEDVTAGNGLAMADGKLTMSKASTEADGAMSKEDKAKLDGIAENANNYVHPGHTAHTEGLYKVTVDDKGHVSAVTAVEKGDITALGIPEQDTTYSVATAESNGLMSSADKAKLDGWVLATSEDLDDIFSNG